MSDNTERPEVLEGYTSKFSSNCGSFFLTLNECGNKLYETRMCIGKSGSCQRLLFDTIAILISVLLQSNISREKIKKALLNQFESNCGNGYMYHNGQPFHSCVDFAITKILEDMGSRGEISLEQEDF